MGTTSSTASTVTGGTIKEVIPPWVYTVKIPPEYAADKMGACSDGMSLLGPNMVSRFRPGQFDTDGARWERGFTSGKHTFEITFPMVHRGTHAGVGVGTEEAPLHVKGKVNLVGYNKHSWGICLRARRSYHKGAIVKKFPTSQAYLPDKFYMYLDADAGTLQFGSDVDYYGGAISGIPRSQPLYPMVACSFPGATITVVYRGKGSTENVVPVTGPVVSVTLVQQQQQVSVGFQALPMPLPQLVPQVMPVPVPLPPKAAEHEGHRSRSSSTSSDDSHGDGEGKKEKKKKKDKKDKQDPPHPDNH